MMTAWQSHEISIRLGDFPNHIQVDLVFDKEPTLEQVREALRFKLTEGHTYSDNESLKFMNAIQHTKELPKKNSTLRVYAIGGIELAILFYTTDILFKVEHE